MRTLTYVLVCLLIVFITSCEKEKDKYLIEYRFINRNDFRKLNIGIEAYTIFPDENATSIMGEAFEINKPDTVSVQLNTKYNYLGYKGCKKKFRIDVETFETFASDSVYYRFLSYVKDTVEYLEWETINNSSDRISTFLWPHDTLVWYKTQDVSAKWKE